MDSFTFLSRSEEDTAALGQALAAHLPSGAVVALCGTLGAGKTRLVQAVAAAAGVAPGEVLSPTFVLVQQYQGRVPIYHFDAYRVADDDEFLALGPEEYFEGGGWSLVEWADRVEACLPHQRVEIRIESLGESERRFTVTAHGDRYQPLVRQLFAWDQRQP